MKTKTKNLKNLVGTAYFCTETRGHKVLHALKAPLLLAGEGCGRCLIGLTATGEGRTQNAFTLAETLITLGVIGVVAAVTLPTLLTNIQDRVRQEQVRTVKYKFTKATEKMNSLGLIGHYDSTMDFVTELKKHMTIEKVCKSNELDKCWPSAEINAYSGTGTTLTKFTPNDISTGEKLKALALSTKDTQTVGIVTGDGVPMILVYSPNCSGFDEAKSYTWSVENGKPVTNATTNCVSAIFDINGIKGPNKIGTDVRTLNSLFGYKLYEAQAMSYDDCQKQKNNLGINQCCTYCKDNGDVDYLAGAVKACHDIGLHLPSMQTLANIAGAIYGRSDIGPYTLIMVNGYGDSQGNSYDDCHDFPFNEYVRKKSDIICVNENIPTDENTSILEVLRNERVNFLSNSVHDGNWLVGRGINNNYSIWYRFTRNYTGGVPLCVGD